MDLRLQRLVGTELAEYVPALAALRGAVFRDFPYLYEGDLEYEARYLETYVHSPESFAVLVWDGERVVGATTALPLADETEEVKRPFVAAGCRLEDFFYFGESVLLPAYRGRGLGVRFFEEREARARERGFPWVCFCAVKRPDDHPLRPEGYTPLDVFWQRRGFARQPELATTFSWRDLGEQSETAKPMVFWTKRL